MSPAKKKPKVAKSPSRKTATREPVRRKKAPAKKTSSKAETKKAEAPRTKVPKAKAARVKTVSPPAAPPQAKASPPAAAAVSAPELASSRARRKKPPPVLAEQVLPPRTPVTMQPRLRLGTKWECFRCGAKFYDLNRPEPLCPKCGANQHERPKVEPKVRIPISEGAAPRPSRSMAPLLEEEEDAVVVDDDELDLGLGGVDASGDGFIGGAEDEEVLAEDEEEA